MSDILSSFLDNKFINERNKISNKINKIILNDNLKSPKFSFSKNINNSNEEIDKILKRIKSDAYINSNLRNKYQNISNSYYNNKRFYDNNKKEKSFSFNNKYNNSSFFFNESKNFNKEESNFDNYHKKILLPKKNSRNNNENNINISTDSPNNKSYNNYIQNNLKLKPIESFTSYKEFNNISRNKKINKLIKINNIIDSLINSNKKDNGKKLYSYIDRLQKFKNKFPIENSISPIQYIKYNLQKNPEESLNNGINKLMKESGKINDIKEYENNLIKKVIDINNKNINMDHLNSENEENIYKKRYEEIIKQTRNYSSFHFNKNKLQQNKIKLKKYSPYQNILDKTYRIYLDKNFGENKIDFNDITENKNQIEKNLEKNIQNYISFDKRVNYILNLSKKTENNVNEKSKEHEKMLNKISKNIKYGNKKLVLI